MRSQFNIRVSRLGSLVAGPRPSYISRHGRRGWGTSGFSSGARSTGCRVTYGGRLIYTVNREKSLEYGWHDDVMLLAPWAESNADRINLLCLLSGAYQSLFPRLMTWCVTIAYFCANGRKITTYISYWCGHCYNRSGASFLLYTPCCVYCHIYKQVPV